MDLEKAIKTRTSIRAFQSKPVPRKELLEVLDVAHWAPSGGNYQPWEFAVVGGAKLAELKKGIGEKVAAGAQNSPDVPRTPPLPDIYLKRRDQNRAVMWRLLRIENDPIKQDEFRIVKGGQLFGAPNAIIICLDKAVGLGSPLIDVGCILENILLAAHDRGLACCTMAMMVNYPDVVRKVLNIPESKNLIVGIAIGYPDKSAPEFRNRSLREPVETFITWHDVGST